MFSLLYISISFWRFEVQSSRGRGVGCGVGFASLKWIKHVSLILIFSFTDYMRPKEKQTSKHLLRSSDESFCSTFRN